MPTPSLRELQTWMRWIITDPRGVDEALSDPTPNVKLFQSRYICPTQDWYACIEDGSSLSRSERLSIYAEGYFGRIAESLEQDFGTLRKVLGEKGFQKLVVDYLKAHPSRSTNIGEVGAMLPIFVKDYTLAQELPILHEIASLECAVIESFYADDLPPMNLESLNSISAEIWISARFLLDPSVHLLKVNWPIDQLWKAQDDEQMNALLEGMTIQETCLLVFRNKAGKVHLDRLSASQFFILEQMKANQTLGEICEALSERNQNELPLMQCFKEWLEIGVIQKIEWGEIS